MFSAILSGRRPLLILAAAAVVALLVSAVVGQRKPTAAHAATTKQLIQASLGSDAAWSEVGQQQSASMSAASAGKVDVSQALSLTAPSSSSASRATPWRVFAGSTSACVDFGDGGFACINDVSQFLKQGVRVLSIPPTADGKAEGETAIVRGVVPDGVSSVTLAAGASRQTVRVPHNTYELAVPADARSLGVTLEHADGSITKG